MPEKWERGKSDSEVQRVWLHVNADTTSAAARPGTASRRVFSALPQNSCSELQVMIWSTRLSLEKLNLFLLIALHAELLFWGLTENFGMVKLPLRKQNRMGAWQRSATPFSVPVFPLCHAGRWHWVGSSSDEWRVVPRVRALPTLGG